MMSSKPIVKMGGRQLATPSEAIIDLDKSLPEILALIQDMKDTMEEKGGVGIAAPQIGCNKRVIMFGFEKNARYPNEKPVPFTVLINPTITILSSETVDAWEGCLSIPGLRGLVPRYNKIEYSGYDQEGQLITRVAEGFHARAVQHEYDHLDGILYPQRIKDLRFFGFEDELIKSPML
jgi:peptide deformylase